MVTAALGPLAMGSTGLQIFGKIAEGAAHKREGKFNQDVAYRNALTIERDGAAEEAQVRDEVRRTMGQQIAAQGESGFETGTGSALDALMASQMEGMLDRMTIRNRARTAADAARMGGDMARMQGKNRGNASYIGAAKVLTDAAKDFASAGAG